MTQPHSPSREASGASGDSAAELRRPFGDGYAGAWNGGGRIYVAVVDPTEADRDAAARLSYFGLPVVVVAAKYTDAEMWEFKDRIVQLMPREAPDDQPYVVGVGFGVRGNDFSSNGQPVVSVSVTRADPQLVARIEGLVPGDALEVSVGLPLRPL